MQDAQNIFYYLDGNEDEAEIKMVSGHVETLSAHGFKASILLGPRDKVDPGSFPEAAPVCRLEGMGLCAGDTIITLDGAPLPEAENADRVRSATLIRNPLMVFQNTWAEQWDTPLFDLVLCASEEASSFAGEVLGVAKRYVVPPAVDPAVYRPLRKENLIACTDGAAVEALFVKHSFLCRNKQHRDMEWIDIRHVPEADVPDALGRASVFLHVPSAGEALVSPLEAMACGCLAVGFRTFGTEDYAGPGNGLWCRPGELAECAQLLEPACALTKSGHRTLERMLDTGRETAAAYSPRVFERVLTAVFSR